MLVADRHRVFSVLHLAVCFSVFRALESGEINERLS